MIDGSLLEGAIYLVRGVAGSGSHLITFHSACRASATRKALLFTLSNISKTIEKRLDAIGCNGPIVLDASTIREEGVTVVAEKLMDTLSSGGAVYIDNVDLFSSLLSNREYQSITYTLERVARMSGGSLVLLSTSADLYEQLFSDVVVEIYLMEKDERMFRIAKVSSPASPSYRSRFLIAFSPKPAIPEPLDVPGGLSIEMNPSILHLLSSLKPGSILELEIDNGVPGSLVDTFTSGVVEAIESSGIQARVYPERLEEHSSSSELLLLSRPKHMVSIIVTCPGRGGRRPLYDGKAVLTCMAGVLVFYFERPWSPAYFLERTPGDKLSLRQFY